MKTNKLVTGIILIGFSILSFKYSLAQTKSGLEEAKKAIAESNAVYHESFVKNDSAIFINCYADDACIMAPNAPQICGTKKIAQFFRNGYNSGLRDSKFISTAVYGEGTEFVTEEGIFEAYDKNGKVLDKGKYLVLWKKTTKGWKMYRDSFSSNWSTEKK